MVTSLIPRLTILHSGALSALPWLVHGFSTRPGGASRAYGGAALNLGFTKDDAHRSVERNRAAFLKSLGAVDGRGRPWTLVTQRQVHSDLIHRVERALDKPLVGDGLVTNVPGLLLAVQTADCLPVVLADPRHKAVGIFHAGWRGLLARILEKGAGAMRRHFGSRPRDLLAALGPGIACCCYAVGEEVREQFGCQFAYAAELFREATESEPVREKYPLLFLTARAPGHSDAGRKLYLDLFAASRRQLLDAGLRPAHLDGVALCTACRTDLFFSHRAEQGRTGRQMGVAGIRA